MKTVIIGKDLVITNKGERVKIKILRKKSKYYIKTKFNILVKEIFAQIKTGSSNIIKKTGSSNEKLI